MQTKEVILGYCWFCKKPLKDNYVFWKIGDEFLCMPCVPYLTEEYLKDNTGGVSAITIAYILERYRRRRRSLNKELRKKILLRYKSTCIKCGEKDPRKLSIDHIKPYSKGGSDNEYNLTVLCKKCNSKKGAKIEVV